MMASRQTPLFSSSSESSRRTSEESTVPSTVISVHDHVLPRGWQCKKDERTNKYYFSREDKSGYDFGPSSTSSSPSHVCCAHKHHPFTTTRYRASEFSAERITRIFPEVDESHITYLLRIYHNQEETVVKTLLGEGCRVHGTTAIDEELFHKLRNNFPHINPDTIRLLLAKNDNREHETITAILGCQTSKGYKFQGFRPTSPKLKLRYLKLLFPEVDEDHLFDLLYNSGHDAKEVIQTLEGLGYKKVDRVGLMLDEERQHEEKAKSVKESAIRPTSIKLQFPKAFAQREQYQKQLQEEFPDVSLALIEMALDSSNQDKDQASLFLRAMTPHDSDKYMPKPKSPPPTKLTFHCKGTQTGHLVDTVPGIPIVIVKTDSVQNEMHHQNTWTKEDGIIQVSEKPRLAKGSDPSLRSGPQVQKIKLLEPKGPQRQNQSRPSMIRVGPTVKRIVKIGAKGPVTNFCKGPDPSLRISKPIITQIDLDF